MHAITDSTILLVIEQVIVGLEQTSYEVDEVTGSIEVCVVTFLGNSSVTLGRPISVNITTVESGASGKCYFGLSRCKWGALNVRTYIMPSLLQ